MPRKAKAAYPNRTDMNTQPVRVPPSNQYGEGAKLEAAQRAMPLPNTAGGPPVEARPLVQSPVPGAGGPLDRPTERPLEPITAGLPLGPGAGPEALGPYAGDDTGIKLRALYAQFPNPDLADLIEVFEANRNG